MKFSGVILLALSLICGPVMAQQGQGTAPLTVQKGGTGSGTAAGARTNLGLGSMAVQNSNAVNIQGGAITGLPTPVNPSDAVNKSYADTVAQGIIRLPPSALATAAALPNTPTYANGSSGVGATLTAGSNSTITVDGVVAPINTVVLVNNQASAFQDGIYTVTTAGSGSAPWVLTRATYFDTSGNMLVGSTTLITGGATNSGNQYALAATVTTVGTTAVTFNLAFSPGVSSIAGNPGAFTLQYPIGNSNNVLVYAGPTESGQLSLSSSTALQFLPYKGDIIRIAGVVYQIPAGGATGCGNTGVFVNGTGSSNLAASTLYYVYLFNNSGTLTCDFSTSGYAVDSTAGNVGTAIETGTSSRSLIGLAATNASSQFSDSVTARLTRSWFNRQSTETQQSLATTTSISSSSVTEYTGFKTSFVIWAGEIAATDCVLSAFSNTQGAAFVTAVSFNGTPESLRVGYNAAAANEFVAVPAASRKKGLPEGLNYSACGASLNEGNGSLNINSYQITDIHQ